MNSELTEMTATGLVGLVKAGQVSPVEIVEACLARIEALDPMLRAFITVAGDQALDAARRAEDLARRGKELGPLHGVPVALKDEAWTAGVPATDGSLLFKEFVPSRNGTIAERLEQAGAIVIGKTNMPEFASWPRSKSLLAGESVNPWDLSRISGASSGGSAAAVSARLVPVAIGSDGGGSIRIPSALCGVMGLFPTPGRVPSYGSFSYSPLGSLGPIARSAADVALVQQVIAGPDVRDATALTMPAPDVVASLDGGVRGLRVGWSPDFGYIPIDERVAAAARALAELLSTLGAHVEELDTRIEHPWGDGSLFAGRHQDALREISSELNDVDLPDTTGEQEWMWKVFATTVPLTATDEFRSLCRRNHRILTPPSQRSYGAEGPPVYLQLPDVDGLRRTMDTMFNRFDVICSPTMATVAPVAPPGWATPYADLFMGTNFTFIANSTGCAAASIPSGLVDGLPAGLQVIGQPQDEATVLRVCYALQAAAPPFPRPPII